MLASGSVTSAAMMAPDRTDVAITQMVLLGFSVDDICGDSPTHNHRCPYCHLLDDPQAPDSTKIETRLLAVKFWKLTADLHRAAQARDHGRSPRAPPRTV